MFEHWKNLFHPHEANDHHPRAYRKGSAIALACVVALILVLSALQTGYIRQSDRFLSSVLPSVLVDLTNEQRTDKQLPKLEHNETLAQAAQMKANHMAEKGYFAHDSPSGVTPWEWFEKVGYTYRNAGENLAVKFSDADKVVEAWMDSPLHRENILEKNFTEIGIATAKGTYEGRDTAFIVQMFGRPDARELAQREDEVTELAVEDENDITTNQSATDQSRATTTEREAPNTEGSPGTTTEQPLAQQGEPQTGDQAQSPSEVSTDTETSIPAISSELTADQNTQATDRQPTSSTETATDTSSQPASNVTAGTQTATTISPAVQGESRLRLPPKQQASRLAHLLSQPQFIFTVLIATLAGLVLLALFLSMIVEIKKHHLQQAGYSLAAILILLGVFYFIRELLFLEPNVAGEQITQWIDSGL